MDVTLQRNFDINSWSFVQIADQIWSCMKLSLASQQSWLTWATHTKDTESANWQNSFSTKTLASIVDMHMTLSSYPALHWLSHLLQLYCCPGLLTATLDRSDLRYNFSSMHWSAEPILVPGHLCSTTCRHESLCQAAQQRDYIYSVVGQNPTLRTSSPIAHCTLLQAAGNHL